MFDISLARYAALHATQKGLANLHQALENSRCALGNEARFKRSDNDFHGVLAAIGRNPILSAVHEALSEWLDDRRAQALQRDGEDHATLQAHTEIVEAIETGGPDAAEAAMRRHLDRHYGTYRQLKQRLAGPAGH